LGLSALNAALSFDVLSLSLGTLLGVDDEALSERLKLG